MRDRLIKILQDLALLDEPCVDGLFEWADTIADSLLSNGVIVPPCKVGDTVYAVSLNTKTNIVSVHRGYIGSIDIRSTGNYLFICHEGLDDEPYFENICGTFDDFGKTVFLTRKEAEAALKERTKGEADGNL